LCSLIRNHNPLTIHKNPLPLIENLAFRTASSSSIGKMNAICPKTLSEYTCNLFRDSECKCPELQANPDIAGIGVSVRIRVNLDIRYTYQFSGHYLIFGLGLSHTSPFDFVLLGSGRTACHKS